MISLPILKKRGVSVEHWSRIFQQVENRMPTLNPYAGDGFKEIIESGKLIMPEYGKDGRKAAFSDLDHLRNRMRMRIQEGREWNFQHYQMFKALDDAFDAPIKRAVTPTMLNSLCGRCGTQEALQKELSAWGFNLDDVILEAADSKVPGQNIRRISAPAFFQIFVPLVKAYVTIRRAKIMNDLNVTPFFLYHPAWESAKTRLQCDVITSRVEVMNEQFDYYNTVDEAVFKMLHYGQVFQFPQEEWYTEEQEKYADNGEIESAIVKEGLRYHLPHPTRVYWDQAYPATSFNTSTGCTFAGYWRVKRYREILANSGYYNRDKIFVGNYNWIHLNTTFFQSVYPCVLSYLPTPALPSNDRETRLIDFVYTKDMADYPIVLTEHFEHLVPSEYGLGDYKYPIWTRFVVAGDDTVIYAAPLAYDPVTYWHYDEDPSRVTNASMSLEVLPWQDHLSNLLTQYYIIIRQNLSNVTFIDTDMVEQTFIDQILNLGEKIFRKRNFIPFSGKKHRVSQHAGVPQAFFSHNFPQMDGNGVLSAMKLTLDMVERVLGMSSQEVGAAASHEQTKAEIQQIGNQTSTRLVYTSTPVRQAKYTMAKQLYNALMAHGDEEFWAQIPFDASLTPEVLESMGFTWDQDEHPRHGSNKRIVVRATKAALMIEQFVQMREGDDKRDNPEMALTLLQFIDRLMKGPAGPAVGVPQMIDLVNLALKLGGIAKDFKLHDATPKQSPEEQQQQMQQQMAPLLEEMQKKIMGEVTQGVTPILERQTKDEKTLLQQQAAIKHLTDIVEIAEAHRPAQLPPAGGMPNGQPNGMPVSPFRY